MLRKWISVVLLMILPAVCLTGCGVDLVHGIIREYEDNKESIHGELRELIDSAKDEIDEWMGSASSYALTGEKSLKGTRKTGIDEYVGSYEAEYEQFNGEEYLFGGTSMERENGSALKVTYSLHIQSGRAVLYWLGSKEEHIISGEKEKHVIAEGTDEDVYEFTFSAGDNFIVLEGEDFTGELSLEVE